MIIFMLFSALIETVVLYTDGYYRGGSRHFRNGGVLLPNFREGVLYLNIGIWSTKIAGHANI